MTPSHFQAISGDNGDYGQEQGRANDPESRIPDPGGTQGIRNLWNSSLGLETRRKNQAWGVEGGNCRNRGGFGALGMRSHGSMLRSAFPECSWASAPDPIPASHKTQRLFQTRFPGESKPSRLGFFFPGKLRRIQAHGDGRRPGWDGEYGKPGKTRNSGALPPPRSGFLHVPHGTSPLDGGILSSPRPRNNSINLEKR